MYMPGMVMVGCPGCRVLTLVSLAKSALLRSRSGEGATVWGLLVERATDNLDLYLVPAADEAGRVEAEVVAEVYDAAV